MKLKHEIIPKGWGQEEIIINNDLYCGKILTFNALKKASKHFHRHKDETFYLESGLVELSYIDVGIRFHSDEFFKDLLEEFNKNKITILLKPGESFHIPPGRIHQVFALEDSVVIEFSTHSEGSDSHRLEKGD